MSEPRPNPIITSLVQAFRRAAIVYDYGGEDELRSLQFIGLRQAKATVSLLDDYGPDGRLSLVPLLEDREPGARVLAAGYLIERMPERALAVLREIDQTVDTRAGMTAYWMLQRYERGDPLV